MDSIRLKHDEKSIICCKPKVSGITTKHCSLWQLQHKKWRKKNRMHFNKNLELLVPLLHSF